MRTQADDEGWARHAATLLAGAFAAAAIWLIAGAPDMAWLGFVLVAITAETRCASWRGRG